MRGSKEYLISLSIEALEEGGYLATSPILKGLVAQGRTMAETLEIAQDVARKIIESYLEHGDPLPAGLIPSSHLSTRTQVKIPVPVAK